MMTLVLTLFTLMDKSGNHEKSIERIMFYSTKGIVFNTKVFYACTVSMNVDMNFTFKRASGGIESGVAIPLHLMEEAPPQAEQKEEGIRSPIAA